MTENVIPAEAVEAAAGAIFQNQTGVDWESRSEYQQKKFRDDAMAALEAAAPYMQGRAWDEG